MSSQVPAYLAELSHARIRGRAVGIQQWAAMGHRVGFPRNVADLLRLLKNCWSRVLPLGKFRPSPL